MMNYSGRRRNYYPEPTQYDSAVTLDLQLATEYKSTKNTSTYFPSQKLKLECVGVVSLFDIMNCLAVGEIAILLDQLHQLVDIQKKKRAEFGGDARVEPGWVTAVGEISQQSRTLFETVEFEQARNRIDQFERGILSDCTIARMQSEIENLIVEIIGELKKRSFFFVSLDRAKVLNEFPFGKEVADAFPSTKEDVEQAASCLAMELHLAAMFHLMRVAEGGLRCLASDRQIVFPTDLKLQTWEDVLRELERCEAKIQNFPKTPKREEQFAFYHGAMMELKRFKNIWRNRIVHLRNEPIDREEALSTFNHVKAFMVILAGHISENSPPTPEIWA
jgi:hypothetical protein